MTYAAAARTAVLLLAAAGAAAAQFALTGIDGAVRTGAPAGFDKAKKALLWRSGDAVEAVPLDRIIGFESDAPDLPNPLGGARLDLVDGDVLYARLEDGPADEIHAVVAGLGRLALKLDEVRVLWNREGRAGSTLELPPAKPDDEDDRLFVELDGRFDQLPGTLERVGKTEVVFSSRAAGDKRPFAFVKDRVAAVRLAVEERRKKPARDCVVRLRDGSRATGVLGGTAGELTLKLASGPTATLDLAQVKGLTMTGDAFSMLSDMEPRAYVETPYLPGGLLHGVVRDRGARPGDPLRIGDERYAKGLLLFARSEATYGVEGFARFVAKIGVDPATKARAAAGAATLTVFVDGKEAWTGPVLRAGEKPADLAVDLKGAKELKLVVGFADAFDAGARVVLGNPTLLK
jgi:hypothetical protein